MNIKNIRVFALLTQEEFAKELDVNPITISRLETGREKPSLKTQRKIMNFCKNNNVPETIIWG